MTSFCYHLRVCIGWGGRVHTQSWRAERKENHETATENKEWNTPHEKGKLAIFGFYEFFQLLWLLLKNEELILK